MEFLNDFANYLWLITKIVLMLILLVVIFKTIIDSIISSILIRKLNKIKDDEEEN